MIDIADRSAAGHRRYAGGMRGDAISLQRWAITAGLVLGGSGPLAAVDSDDEGPEATARSGLPDEGAVWRIEIDNDLFLGTDNQLTSGWSVQRHSPPAGAWEDVHAPRWLADLGAHLPTLDPDGHVKRFGIGIGQLIQTPDDLTRSDVIPDDTPYAATLGIFASWTAVSPEHVTGLQVFLGVIGEPALGEPFQKTVHEVIDAEDPQGWDNQVGFEPLLNLTYGQWFKLAGSGSGQGFAADLSAGGFASLGNLRTALDGTVQSRIGWNLPAGFAPIPDPGGIGIAQLPRVGRPERTAWFLSIGGRARALAYSILLDGSLFDTDGPEAPDREIGVLQAVVGAHVVHDDMAFRLHYVFSTDPIDSEQSSRSWGAATVEWSF